MIFKVPTVKVGVIYLLQYLILIQPNKTFLMRI